MPLGAILLLAMGLAMDATAVALGVGTSGQATSPRPMFRLSFHFGLFQALMPILGWLAGTTVAVYISAIDHWVAFGLLAFVGGRMIREGLDPDCDACPPNPTRGGTLVMLSLATSIDAFAVGLSLAIVGVSIWYPAAIIGIVTGSLTLAGLLLGNRLGASFGKRIEILGGVILILIGLRVLVGHLFGI